jgi:hypothetical protein
MISLLGILLATSSSDTVFHNWCDRVGIETPQARLRTTPESVAGRGVFAVGDVKQGDVVIRIPEDLALHEFNAAQSFPVVARNLLEKRAGYYEKTSGKKKPKSWRRRLLSLKRKIFNNDEEEETEDSEFSFITPEDLWQAELTAFSTAILEEENHIWAPWISQWQRRDPMQNMYERGISWQDESAIDNCAKALQKLLPDASESKLRAAVHIRLGRMNELKQVYGLADSDLAMCGVVISRAIELGNGIVGVIPMFDMVNHSKNPNLGLHFNGEEFGLCALCDIAEGEEFFLRYDSQPDAENWDENSAVWSLVQWGIPETTNARVAPPN